MSDATPQLPPSQPALQSAVPPPAASPINLYPKLTNMNNEHPNRLLAFPVFGFIIRIILTLPAFVVLFLLMYAYLGAIVITSFYILFTRKYWQPAHAVTVAYLIYTIKINLYMFGLTDKYPGFNFETNNIFELDVGMPEKPSRLLAFPLLGSFLRAILLIPYFIFAVVLANGTQVAVLCSWFGVLFTGKYPESLYEFNCDNIRVSSRLNMYAAYLSDTYPSFHISLNHKTIKIILIILGAALMLFSSLNDFNGFQRDMQQGTTQEKNL
jgi:hypothetical protein